VAWVGSVRDAPRGSESGIMRCHRIGRNRGDACKQMPRLGFCSTRDQEFPLVSAQRRWSGVPAGQGCASLLDPRFSPDNALRWYAPPRASRLLQMRRFVASGCWAMWCSPDLKSPGRKRACGFESRARHSCFDDLAIPALSSRRRGDPHFATISRWHTRRAASRRSASETTLYRSKMERRLSASRVHVTLPGTGTPPARLPRPSRLRSEHDQSATGSPCGAPCCAAGPPSVTRTSCVRPS